VDSSARSIAKAVSYRLLGSICTALIVLLFSGDLFASYFFNVHRPPAILNSVPEHFTVSVEKIRRLNPGWIVPSHYDYLDGALHRRRFAKLNRIQWPEEK